MDEQANPQRGELLLEKRDGTTVGIRFDLNAICMAERVLGGRAITDIVVEFATGQVAGTVVRAIVWAGVIGYRKAHPTKDEAPFNLEDAGRLIYDEVGISKAAHLAGEALRLAFPNAGDEGDDEPGSGEPDANDPGKAIATSSGEGS